jgi:hypothetical protein
MPGKENVMKRFYSQLVVAGIFLLVLGLVPSAAQAGICSKVCTPTASCDLVCTAIGGGSPEITTCGEWGRCAGFASTDVFTLESSKDACSEATAASASANLLDLSAEPRR